MPRWMSRKSLFGLLFACLAAILLAWYVFNGNTLTAAADDIVVSLQEGQTDRLFDAMIPEEIACSNVNRDKLRALWREMIAPRIRESKYLYREKTEMSDNGWQATSGTWYQDSTGEPWRLFVIVNEAAEGPRYSVLISLLSLSYLTPEEIKRSSNTYLSQLRKYRPLLESVGVERIMINPARCLSLDDLEAKLAGVRNAS